MSKFKCLVSVTYTTVVTVEADDDVHAADVAESYVTASLADELRAADMTLEFADVEVERADEVEEVTA
jgi:hypothetical protein